MKYLLLSLAFIFSFQSILNSQHSVAREWNEANLNAVRLDLAQPTLTARNLWHVSAAMYDAWAVFDLESETYFLGKEVGGFYIPFNGMDIPGTEEEVLAAQEEAVSYAAYRVLLHRYAEGYVPEGNEAEIQAIFDDLMVELGYDTSFTDTDFSGGNPAALGNYIAEQIILFGQQDGSNELELHENQYYQPENVGILQMVQPGNPSMQDPNRWQRILQFIGQNEFPIDPNFLSPEWGNVTPAVLTEEDVTLYERDENFYKVYCDPGTPPFLDETTDETGLDDDYKYGFMMVAVWSSLLDYTDGNMIDISPNNIGNITSYPESIEDYDEFYDFFTGDDASQGYSVNPATGMPYEEQIVPMGDYGRVLAEFWADGPDSETPPGHWYTILNYVNDHPDLEKKWNGQGDILDNLEWDVKTYFTLGANMHDCAIASWGVKGWYDYVRPVSAIRYMADQGQCSDMTLPNYSPSGLPLIEGFSELVDLDDPLIGVSQENLNKVKIKAWKGPEYLDQIDLETDELLEPIQDSTVAGVDWILAERWWPYQRPNFITPPFAGYVSGHSTFSRGAAEVLAQMTGDEYFPGGMGVFPCPQNDFLVFEEGPSIDLELQWARYVDASDQCSLSRIFGGIHPPADDIPGRIIGQKVGEDSYALADDLFNNEEPRVLSNTINTELINDAYAAQDLVISVSYNREMDTSVSPVISFSEDISTSLAEQPGEWLTSDTYQWTFTAQDADVSHPDLGFTVSGGADTDGTIQLDYSVSDRFTLDTENPTLQDVVNVELINEAAAGTLVELSFEFNEAMTAGTPAISFSNQDPTVNSLSAANSIVWSDDFNSFTESYLVADADEELNDIMAMVSGLSDAAGNAMVSEEIMTSMTVDTKAPEVLSVEPSGAYLNEASVTSGTFSIVVTYDDDMSQDVNPVPDFPFEEPGATMTLNTNESAWISSNAFEFVYDLIDEDLELDNVDFNTMNGADDAGNQVSFYEVDDVFHIDTKAPEVVSMTDFNVSVLNDASTDEVIDYLVSFDDIIFNQDEVVLAFSPEVNSLTNPVNDWLTDTLLEVNFTVSDANEEVEGIEVSVSGAQDEAGNSIEITTALSELIVDNKNPCALVTANVYDVTADNEGEAGFQIIASFDEDLNPDLEPTIAFPVENPDGSITLNADETGWFGSSYIFSYDVATDLIPLAFIDVEFQNVEDEYGNAICQSSYTDFFSIELDTFLNVIELEELEVLIYPNPVTRGEDLMLNKTFTNATYQFIDNTGRLVAAELNANNAISTSHLSAGSYYLRIVGEGYEHVFKVIIQD